MKPVYHRVDVKNKVKNQENILRVISFYSRRNNGTTQLENDKKLKLKIPQPQQ
jgi:hypothetical protein